MTLASRNVRLFLLLAAMVLASLPFWAVGYTLQLASNALVAAMFALSLQLLVGGAGMVSMGHAAFFGVGAYSIYLLAQADASSSILLTLPAAALLAAVAALAVGLLAVRTRNFYFIMTTLAFGQMLFFLFNDTQLGGGKDGVFVARPSFAIFGLEHAVARRDRPAVSLWTNLVILIALFAASTAFMRTLYGRALQGIKANEHRMRALGYHTERQKLGAFTIAGSMAGIAGHQSAMTEAFVNPELLGWHRSAEALLMILLGGIGTLHGPLLGAFAYVGIAEVAQVITERQRLVQGAIILFAVLVLRRGLAGIGQR